MLRMTIAFIAGVYVGQEYGKLIPNVKAKTLEYITEFKKSDIYKKMTEDVNEEKEKKKK